MGNCFFKLAFEHVFEPMVKGKDIKGGHHLLDGIKHYAGYSLEDIKIHTNGYYKATIKCGKALKKGKTFFPNHWSRKKVAKKILEAYENFLESGKIIDFKTNGKANISGFTKGGIEIMMHVARKTGIKTAYPLLTRKNK